jgi:hypothetical protein
VGGNSRIDTSNILVSSWWLANKVNTPLRQANTWSGAVLAYRGFVRLLWSLLGFEHIDHVLRSGRRVAPIRVRGAPQVSGTGNSFSTTSRYIKHNPYFFCQKLVTFQLRHELAALCPAFTLRAELPTQALGFNSKWDRAEAPESAAADGRRNRTRFSPRFSEIIPSIGASLRFIKI